MNPPSSIHYPVMPRTPLATISSNRRRNTQLSPYERGLLVGASALGATAVEVEKVSGVPESIVRTTLSRASERHNGETKPRSGRPGRLSIRDQRHIIRIARVQPTITYKNLQKEAGVVCSRSTLYRCLKAYGLTNWLAKKRPLLTPEVAAKRLAWCQLRKDWTFDKWKQYIWSDECSVERGTGKERKWVFRTPQEKWNKEMIEPYKKGKDITVIVWAAFWGSGRSDLIRMARDSNARRQGYSATSYLQLLEENLLGIWEPGLTYMQDNAPIHKARKVTEWFEHHGITVIDWPPYFPDLNPIEHLWFRLKQLVYEVRPDIDEVGGSEDIIRDALFEALEEAWTRIDGQLMEDLIRSMDNRIQAVIAADGWYTRF